MQLQAGPVQVHYENGFLRCFSVDGLEVLRMIYFAARDRNWSTARIAIQNESIRSTPDSFSIQYDWQINDLGIEMVGTNFMEGRADGSIQVRFSGNTLNTFWRNRLGLCALHPIANLAGQPCWIEHPDGNRTESLFPDHISPYQPFLNIRAMKWQMASGPQFRLYFEGDVFETEDQRNWTDTSFKTYSTPLEIPFPVFVPAGTEILQSISFQVVSLENQPAKVGSVSDKGSVPVAGLSKPKIGLGYRSEGPALVPEEVLELQKIDLSHLRADVFFGDSQWQTRLLGAAKDAASLAIPLELALFFTEKAETEARQICSFLLDHSIQISSVSVFEAHNWTTSTLLLNQVIPVLRTVLPAVLVGGGTDSNFVDLNRTPFDYNQVDFVTYSINPQSHAFDDKTILENIAAQADTVLSAQLLSGGKPIHISPVTLLPRFNPVIDNTIVHSTRSVRGTQPADPRQKTDFCARWTRQSLETLSNAGAVSITYFETHGPRGLLDKAEIYPVFAVFQGR